MTSRVWLGVVIACALLVVWLTRYDLQSSVGGAYLLDRWTGDVYYASPSGISKLKQ